MKTRKKFILGTAIALALFGTVGFAAPANAAPPTPSPTPPVTTVSNVVQMVPDGFNAAVAAADGYRIVTDANGSQSSVPVTAQAIAQQAAAARSKAAALASPGKVTPDNEVTGDCGSSWVYATKKANNTVAYTTGYIVFGRVVSSQWEVEAAGFISGSSVVLDPGANDGHWSAEGTLVNVVGPGFAYVNPISSFAVLASGEVCTSGAPTASFG